MTIIAGKTESMEGHTGPCPPLTRSPECLETPEARQGCVEPQGHLFSLQMLNNLRFLPHLLLSFLFFPRGLADSPLLSMRKPCPGP